MSDQPDDIWGDNPLPDPDPALAAWYAREPAPTMPPEVWSRLSAALAAEPALTATPALDEAVPTDATVVSLDEARERRARRWLPAVGAAAGAVLIGVVAVPLVQGGIAAGPAQEATVTASTGDKAADVTPVVEETPTLLTQPTPSPTPEVTGPSSTPSTPSAPAPSLSPQVDQAAARVVLASGTDYTAGALNEQVDGLLQATGYADGAQIATVQTTPLPTTPPVIGSDGFTASTEDMSECLAALAETPLGLPALVVDRARYNGTDAAVVVMVHSILEGATAPEVVLDVFVVGPECTEEDRAQATWYLHSMP